MTRIEQLAREAPVFEALRQGAEIDWDLWHRAGAALETSLAGTPALERRVHHWYMPVLSYAVATARQAAKRPVLIGIQAPQGAGKTTLVTHLLDAFPLAGLRAAAVSIDDFYLTRSEQVALAAAHPGNPYLEHRGYPGTHDLGLGATTLAGLRALGESGTGESVSVPAYDKSAFGGRGDRAPEDRWRRVAAPLDVVFLEGWMLGFEPVPEDSLADVHLAAPNRALGGYAQWTDLLDAFVVIRALDPTYVLTWRVQAEEAMKARGLPGLDRAAIEDYVRRFLPAYEHYAGRAPGRFRDTALTIYLDSERRPTFGR